MEPRDFCISVVITSFNQKNFLIEAIESVINQTIRPHEIIIADDHSTVDDSVELIQDYIARYPGLIKGVFQKENVGIPKNRNAALHRVTGNYVSILDGDDRFLPHKNERELQALQMHAEAKAVYSNLYFIDRTGSRTSIRDKTPQPMGNIFKELFAGKTGILRSMLIEYSALEDLGFMDPAFWHCDGFDLTVRFAHRYSITYLPDPLSEFRVHLGGASGWRKSADSLKDRQRIYQKNKPLLADLSTLEREEVIKGWSRHMFRLRVRDALERGNRAEAFLVTMSMLAKDHVSRLDLLASITPEPVRRTIRLLRKKG